MMINFTNDLDEACMTIKQIGKQAEVRNNNSQIHSGKFFTNAYLDLKF